MKMEKEFVKVSGPTGKFLIDGKVKKLVDGKEFKSLSEKIVPFYNPFFWAKDIKESVKRLMSKKRFYKHIGHWVITLDDFEKEFGEDLIVNQEGDKYIGD